MHRFVALGFCFAVLAACEQPTSVDHDRASDTGQSAVAIAQDVIDNPPASLTLLRRAAARSGQRGSTQALQAVQQTLVDDPALLAATLYVTTVERQALRNAEWFRPTVSTTTQALIGQDLSASLFISQPVYDFGKRRAQVSSLLTQANRTRLNITELQQGLAQDMFLAALNAQLTRAQIDLNKRRISAFQAALNRANTLLALDIVGSSDARLAQVRLDQAKKDLRTAEIGLRQSTALWARLAGTSTPPRLALADDILGRFGLNSLSRSQDLANQHSLDLKIGRADLALRQSDVIQADLATLPTVNAVSSTRLAPSGGDRWGVGLSVDYTLYSRSQRDELASTQDRVNAQQARIQAIARDLTFNVQSIWQNMQDSRELAQLERSGIATLRARADDLQEQLNTGLIPFDRVVDARSEQFDTELAALANQFAADRAALELLLVSGVLTAGG
ncbi:MAG: TolC family protein [Pseudomonadota bacterium]